jgi:hypothetical protein
LNCLERCGEQFRRRYIEGERVPPSPRMLRGTVVHRVAKTALLRKLEENELPSIEEAKDLAATEFEAQWAGGVSFEQEPTNESANAAKAYSKDFAVDLSAMYVGHVAPAVNPVAVERQIKVTPKDSDLVIHGTLDLVDQKPEGEIVRDTKTSEKSPNKDAAERSQQLTYYAMIRQAEVGQLPAALQLDYLVRTPARAERKHIQLLTQRSSDDVRSLVARLNTAVEAVKRGVFVPTSPESWWCSPSWCDFYSTCVYVRRGYRPQS